MSLQAFAASLQRIFKKYNFLPNDDTCRQEDPAHVLHRHDTRLSAARFHCRASRGLGVYRVDTHDKLPNHVTHGSSSQYQLSHGLSTRLQYHWHFKINYITYWQTYVCDSSKICSKRMTGVGSFVSCCRQFTLTHWELDLRGMSRAGKNGREICPYGELYVGRCPGGMSYTRV